MHTGYSNWHTNVTQIYFQLVKLEPQMLLKITQNKSQLIPTNDKQIDPQTLRKIT